MPNLASDLNTLNLYYSLAHRILSKTPIPAIYREKLVNFHNIPLRFRNEEEYIEFTGDTGKTEIQINLANLMINTTNRVNEALNYEKEIKKEEQEKKFKSKLINEFKLVEDSNKLVGRILEKNIIISYRSKSLESIVHKLNIGEDKNKGKKMGELKIEDLGDIYGLTLEIDGEPEDVLEVFHKIHNFIINDNKVKTFKLTTKTANFQEIIKNMKDDGEAKKFFESEKVELFRKPSTSKNYSEIIKGNYTWDGLPIELKYILHGTRNQHGLSFQGVYAYWEKYLKGYVRGIIEKESPIISPSKIQIEIVVEHFLRHISEIIDENPEKKGTKVRDYKEELWGDLKKENFLEKSCTFGEKTLDEDLLKGLYNYFYSKAHSKTSFN